MMRMSADSSSGHIERHETLFRYEVGGIIGVGLTVTEIRTLDACRGSTAAASWYVTTQTDRPAPSNVVPTREGLDIQRLIVNAPDSRADKACRMECVSVLVIARIATYARIRQSKCASCPGRLH